MVRGIWATGTVRRRSKNLPGGLHREPNSDVRGSMLIRTHVHRQMGVVSWQDSKLVTLISTAAPPWAPEVTVLRRIPGLRDQLIVPSSPMHVQYTEYMQGVDVTGQLQGNSELLLPASVPQMVDKTIPFCCGPNHGECVRHVGKGDGGPWSSGWYSPGIQDCSRPAPYRGRAQ